MNLRKLLKIKFTPFPCIYGIAGFNLGHLRYGFLDGIHVNILASLLKDYLPNARTFGKMTSLVVFFKPDKPLAMREYHELFWNVLNDLSKIDSHKWPGDIPREIDHANWEFCFYGEPIFVVCNTPAHVKRKTRKFSNFMLTFQPRWVFDDILGGDQQSIDRAIQPVRERIKKYDMIPPSPDLGLYGNPENRESYVCVKKKKDLEKGR